MPELVEVERARQAAERVVGGRIGDVEVLDPLILRGGIGPEEFARSLAGRRVTGARRRGKLLLLDTGPRVVERGPGPTLGLWFAMTGILVVDGVPSVGGLLYAPIVDPRWVRLRLRLQTKGRRSWSVEFHDPRRLGRVMLDPPEDRLGPDAASITPRQLRAALGPRGASRGPALKAALLDQSRVAGIGNLIADEVLWRSGLSPERPVGGLDPAEVRRLHRHLVAALADLSVRGGSHLGDVVPARGPGRPCPRDGAPMQRTIVGGRTTWWCPAHQR